MFCKATVPIAWIILIMSQLTKNRFELHTLNTRVIYIDSDRGSVEGSPISVILIALVLSYLMALLDKHPVHNHLHAALEGDACQARRQLVDLGWIDDWLLFAPDVEALQRKRSIWSELLASLGWRLHKDKLQVMFTSCPEETVFFDGQ